MAFAQKIRDLFSFSSVNNNDFFDELTDTLIEGDLSAKTAFTIIEELEKNCKKQKITQKNDILQILKDLLIPCIHTVSLSIEPKKTNVFLVLGVNGAGKTTTIAKMAGLYSKTMSEPIVFAAADTFRAAAIEQLSMHAQRLGFRVIAHAHGADPSAVVFDAADSVSAQGGGLVLADTAGRLHNKENLVRELQKINRIAESKASEGCYKKILVLDATTGQNALRQAEVFNESIGIDAVILTKYDSSAKGGVAFSLGRDLNIPLAYICNGESYDAITNVDSEVYVRNFLGM